MWSRIESGAIAVHTVESSEPSPFAHAILSGRPFTYLDDAPLEERRTRALSLRRGLGELGPDGLPVPASELAALDPDAVAVVLDQVRPRLRNADELHDLLLSLVAARPHREWAQWFDALGADGRASLVDGGWVATERRAAALALSDDDEAAAACVAGHLQLAGPVTVEQLVADAAAALGRADGGAAVAGPGPHRPGPARRQGLRHCAARRTLVRAQPVGAAARRQPEPAARHGRRGADRRVRALPHALAARDARQPRRGPGRAARSPGAAAGDRGAGGRVGGPDPARPCGRLRHALARRALLVRRNRVGASHTAGRADRPQWHALARHAARLRAA